MSDPWGGKLERLSLTRRHYHNYDYLRFLVESVWKLHCPTRLVDFGCGSGYLGVKLLPLMPEGSTNTGLDSSPRLLDQARSVFADAPWETNFVHADMLDVPLGDDSFDVAMSHSSLMHLSQAERGVAEMVRLTRSGGLVIACESNWNGFNAMNHVDELDELAIKDLGFLQRLFAHDRETDGKDGNLGVKLPVLLHKAGLVGVDARVTDAVRCCLPPLETAEKSERYEALRADGLARPVGTEDARRMRERFLERGFSAEEAEEEIRRATFQAERFAASGRDFHIVSPLAMMFSFGRVP